MLAKRVERSGKDWGAHLPFVRFVYRASLQESTKESPFIYCMDVIPGCQLLLDWTGGSSSSSSKSLIGILIRQKWLLNFRKLGSWQGTILRKYNSAKRSTMTVGQDYQGVRWVIELLFVCLLPKHVRL